MGFLSKVFDFLSPKEKHPEAQSESKMTYT